MMVIGITGFIGAGKTTVAKYLIEKHGFVRARFAGALKEMLRAFLAYQGVPEHMIDRMVDGDLKEKPSAFLGGRTPRYAMESLGNCWGRDDMHADLWVRAEAGHLALGNMSASVVFEDVRNPNEARFIQSARAGAVWRIEQPGLVPKDDCTTEKTQLAVVPNRIIINEIGKLEATYAQIDAALDEIRGAA